jgi:hypothetical protein
MLRFALKLALTLGIAGAAATNSQAGILAGLPESTLTAITESLDNTVKAEVVVRGPVVRRGPVVVGPRVVGPPRMAGPGVVVGPRVAWGRGVRPFVSRPHYGLIIGGVALGSIIAATAYGVVPARPAPNLCWYWADPAMINGYWDYC